jgi:predicted nuclease of restriction endonuclease-like (RecB) superfamily
MHPVGRRGNMVGERSVVPNGYGEFLADLKVRIRAAQLRATLAVNSELVLLYWHLGREILARQTREGWGAQVIDRLSRDLRHAFPEMRGFSVRNLKYMRTFAEAYGDDPFVQQVAAQLPWFHICTVLDRLKDPSARGWYLEQALTHGWSRAVLVHQIETGAFDRAGRAVTNFAATLPAPQSELAQQLMKDPYKFDFLTLGPEARERDLERELLKHVRDFLLELGAGFAFVGSQYHIEVGGEDFYLDLLFYHLRLRCFVVVDLKMGDFMPEYAGKMNFYLSAVDDLLRNPHDQPSLGIILCKTRNRIIVEYALRDTQKPIGVSEYQLRASLPDALRGNLPTVEELEAELGDPQDQGT